VYNTTTRRPRDARRVIIYDRLPSIYTNRHYVYALRVYTYIIMYYMEIRDFRVYTTRRLQTPLDLYIYIYIIYDIMRIGRSCNFSGPSSPFRKRIGESSTVQTSTNKLTSPVQTVDNIITCTYIIYNFKHINVYT